MNKKLTKNLILRLAGVATCSLATFYSASSWSKENTPEYKSDYKQDIKVTQLLKTQTTSIGQPINFATINKPEVTAVKVEIPPGKETGWHKHPHPGYAYIIQGTLTLELERNQKFTFKPGSTFVEVVGTLHNGKNLGNEPVILIAFFTAEAGQPFAIPANPK
ncbi:hypothetical protein Syn7502_03288 [Synechococcus sp. PCC 7502]|uniref:cupin domain-containing protein n=1 Tax=Synechococcus sp. PCC 7502 TaxID=1173263 RepID=UPI00029FF4F6|nr:cupin domain-containing protein [Synechococcus sp. PCC 7502]AFY75154.1 hypothetical protein Syn7502_03288 [Synechococcus sp. PCC 7502]